MSQRMRELLYAIRTPLALWMREASGCWAVLAMISLPGSSQVSFQLPAPGRSVAPPSGYCTPALFHWVSDLYFHSFSTPLLEVWSNINTQSRFSVTAELLHERLDHRDLVPTRPPSLGLRPDCCHSWQAAGYCFKGCSRDSLDLSTENGVLIKHRKIHNHPKLLVCPFLDSGITSI